MAHDRLAGFFGAWRGGFLTVLALLACMLLPGLAAAQGSTSFNHDTTQFSLRGAHEIVRCETCHLNGVFKGTPKACNLCHVQGSKTNALPMTANHIPVSDQCDTCHNTSTFTGTQFTHAMVMPGSCNTCHNNYYAKGKTPNHPLTTASCDVCHTIGAFLPVAQFDHAGAGIFAAPAHAGPRCDSCHFNGAGSKAVGKTQNHVPVKNAAADCDACHRQTTSWRPALFDHHDAGIDVPPNSACSSCHNGSYSMGKPAGTAHIPTTRDCYLCHNNSPVVNPGGFSLGAMNHLGITTGCATCHGLKSPYPPLNGKSVTTPGAIANHIPFGTASCESCHAIGTFTSWSGAVMNHAAVTSLSCATCHEDGSAYAGLNASTSAVMRSSLGTHIPVPTSLACSVCHGSTTSFTQGVIYSTAGTHQSSVVSQGCNACHTAGSGPFAAVPSLVTPDATPTLSGSGLPHVALVGGADCQSCHTPSKISSYDPGANGFRIGAANISNPTLTASTHGLVSGSCASCHQAANFAGMLASTDTVAGDSFPSAALDLVHQGFTGDCATCHTTSPKFATNAFGGVRPAGHIPVGSTTCQTCHGTSGSFTNPDITATHTTGQACSACHNSAQSNAAKTIGGTSPLIVYAGSNGNHMPIGTLGLSSAAAGTPTCESSGCHTNYPAASNFKINGGAASITTPSLTPAGHSSVFIGGVVTCTTCHESTAPLYQGMVKTGASSAQVGDSRPAYGNHPRAPGDCGLCHTTQATFAQHFSESAQPAGHIPVGTAICSACHSFTGNVLGNYSIANTHSAQSQPCETCHNATVSGGIAANAAALGFGGVPATPTVYADATHFPIGALTCAQSGCHASYASSAIFKLGSGTPAPASGTSLFSAAGHALVAGTSCVTCHSAGAAFKGMLNDPNVVSDAFPSSTVDPLHQSYSGSCATCHTTSPSFNNNVKTLPAKHLPTGTAGVNCAACHSATASGGGYATFNAAATHSATTSLACISCHSAAVVATALVSPAGTPKLSTAVNHIPFGSLDCASSGCHKAYATSNVFLLGSANLSPSLLSVAGHTAVAGAGVNTCSTCHNKAGTTPFAGMIASQVGGGDQFPSAAEDPGHQSYTGDCSTCHTTTPKFATNVFGGAKPTGHIPTGTIGACSTCHAGGVYTSPDLTQTHNTGQACAVCHNPAQSSAASSIGGTSGVIVYNGSANAKHIPIGTLGSTSAAAGTRTCEASGCHSGYTAGGNFKINGGAASISSPNLVPAGHTSVFNAGVASCLTCHEAGTGYQGMLATGASTAAAGDTRPAYGNHPTNGDCGACHTTQATFAQHVSSVAEPTGHIPTGTAGCTSCHTVTNGVFGAPSISNTHTAQSQSCETCHNASVSAGIAANATALGSGGVAAVPTVYADSSHFPIGALTCAQSGCHASYASNPLFKLGTPAPASGTSLFSTAGHALVANYSCATCHGSGTAFKGMVSDPSVVSDVAPSSGLDPIHQAYNGGCDTCHTTAPSFNNNAKVLPPNHLPTGTAGVTCATCHTAGPSGGGYAVANIASTHSATTSLSCVSCHSSTVIATALLSAAQTPKLATAVNHIPFGTLDCATSGCHKPYATSNVFLLGSANINPSLLNTTAHSALAGVGLTTCGTCHTKSGTTPFAGMLASRVGGGDQFPSATEDAGHQSYTGDCSTCHTTAPTFATNATGGAKPTGHIPTGSVTACVTCHAGGVYTNPNITATHTTGQACAVCHNPVTSAGAASIGGTSPLIVFTTSNSYKHIPIGTLGNTAAAAGTATCDSSGCHAASAYTPGSFLIRAAALTNPSLNVSGHSSVQLGGVSSCITCHESGTGYAGMIATVTTNSTTGTAGDTRPGYNNHPSTGDCGGCHSTSPTFAQNQVSAAQPTGHIPSAGASCGACHAGSTATNFPAPSILSTHTATASQACAVCHNSTVSAAVAANATNLGSGGVAAVPPKYNDATHFPIGSVGCNAGGCHTTYTATTSTFVVGVGSAGSITAPTLNGTGHASVTTLTCVSCHAAGSGFKGMVTNAAVISDVFPASSVDALHQTYTGDCSACHSSAVQFLTNVTTLPPKHLPTGTAGTTCSTCHSTATSAASYGAMTTAQIAQTHTSTASLSCISCHAATVTATALSTTALMPKLSTAVANHIPFGGLDCAASGCHRTYTTAVTNFVIGSPSITSPTLNVAGHSSVAGAGQSTCGTCHTKTGGIIYAGMLASQVGGGDQFPTATEDPSHQGYVGDCVNCHTTVPTFATNNTGGALPSNHIPLSAFAAAPACSVCHINPSNYSVAQMSHSGLTSGCKTCHGATQLSFANVTPMAEPATHVPTTLAGMNPACETCHRNGQTGNFASFAGTVMDHAGITTSCASCHKVGSTYYGVTMVVAPNGTTDGHHYVSGFTCETCHTNKLIPGGFANGTFVHSTLGNPAPCTRCHETTSLFTGVSNLWVRPSGHNVGVDCGNSGCHNTNDNSVGTGTTAVAGAVLSPTTVVMSSSAIGSAVTRQVVLVNSGTAALTLTTIALSGTNATDFTQTNTCGTSLAAGASCAFTITFTPTAAGNRTATLTLTDNAFVVSTTKKPKSSTQTVSLTGAVATTTLSASTAATMTSTGIKPATSPLQALTFKNVGTTTVTLSSVSISGAHAGDFVLTNGCGTTLAAAASCTISVAFSPAANLGVQETATLNIADSGFPSTYALPLVGSIASSATAAAKVARVMSAAQPRAGGLAGLAAKGQPGQANSASTSSSLASVLALPPARPVPPISPVAGLPGRMGLPAPAVPGVPVLGSRGLPVPVQGTAPVVPGAPIAAPAAPTGIPGLPGQAGGASLGTVTGAAVGGLPLPGAAAATARQAVGTPVSHATAVPGQCQSCHNGRIASTTPKNHMITGRSCDQCHRTNAWTPVLDYRHISPKYQPHDASVTCLSCHTSKTETVISRFPAYGMSCASCHADRFRPQQHRRADRPNQFYSVMDLQDCAGSCHLALPGRLGTTPTMFGYHRSMAPAF